MGQTNNIHVFNKAIVQLATNKAIITYVIPLNVTEDTELKPINIQPIQQEITQFLEINQQIISINANNEIFIYQFQNLIESIEKLQISSNFDGAIALTQFLQDFKMQGLMQKQLTAQKAIFEFTQQRYDVAFELFLKSRVDPISVLYLFTHPSFQLIDYDIAKQVISLEQLSQNLSFEIPQLKCDPNNLDDSQTMAINQLRCYMHSWRGEIIENIRVQIEKRINQKATYQQIYDEMTLSQRKQIGNLDEAFLKCYLYDPLGCDNAGIIQLFKTANLFIDTDTAVKLLKDRHPDALISFLKTKQRHRQALDYLQLGDPIEVGKYLHEIGYGSKQSPINDSLKALSREFMYKVFQKQPEFLVQLFGIQNQEVHPIDIQIYDFIEDQDVTYKTQIYENALKGKNYHDQEWLLLQLVQLYVALIHQEVNGIINVIQNNSYNFQQKIQYLNQTINTQSLLKRVNQEENQDLVTDLIFEVENELLCHQIPNQSKNITTEPRLLSDQIQGSLGSLRRKLTRLIKQLQKVDFQKFLDVIPQKEFTEDRAILLCKKYDFEQGLSLFAISLGQPLFAEAICDQIYQDSLQTGAENRQLDIYLILLRCFLTPQDAEPFFDAALTLLSRRFNKMNALDVLELLPKDKIKIKDLQVYLRIITSTNKLSEVDGLVVQHVYAAQYQYQKQIIENYTKAETIVQRNQKCPLCGDLLKKEVVVFENGRVSCSRCYTNAPNQCDIISQMKPVKGHKCFWEVFE
ncbi:Vacuolar_sorting protein [Hexamita inflata]|uniref:Vacuolar sorting protein n=1 Tax=Hexamita inflata TaxID=28002 RepID=A0AA86R925_9EUKA|nr:Vacuolar sorting protein [Hexamita inflata]